MEIRFPLFQGGRILRKESLWDIRDYAYMGWQLLYADYTDGILCGCELGVDRQDIIIGKGMIKYHDFIYFVKEEIKVSYEANDIWMVLKAEFCAADEQQDYDLYRVEFFLDRTLDLQENQIELCRFCLRKGSVLRAEYKNLEDMSTEYDTVNFVHATVAGAGRAALHPKILNQFACELAQEQSREAADYAFLYEVQNKRGEVSRQAVAQYLLDKDRGSEFREIYGWTNERVYSELKNILSSKCTSGSEYGRNIIYVE